ncbi:MAG: hypothetical protein ABI597_00560 [Gammaproteobacteria bacterium]
MLSQRAVTYKFAKTIKALLCCPCNVTCGFMCWLCVFETQTSPQSLASKDDLKMEQDATDYFCGCDDDKLTIRCTIISRALNPQILTETALSKYEKANKISVGFSSNFADSRRGLDPDSNLKEKLWTVFNEFYYSKEDILDTSTTNERHVHKLQVLGHFIAQEIVAKLPENLNETAQKAGRDTTNEDLYRIYYHGLIKEILTVEFVKEILPRCYQRCNAQILAEESKQANTEQAIQSAISAAHKTNNLFPPKDLFPQTHYERPTSRETKISTYGSSS